jgi:hypothetical protein
VFSAKQLDDYNFLRPGHRQFIEMDGKQLGNPDKVAQALMELVNVSNPPTHLFLGSDAFKRASDKIQVLSEQLETWK